MKTLRAASLLALASFAVASQADVFTESVQFGPGPTDFNGSTGMTAGPGGNRLYPFDSNGGILNSITFSYKYSISSQITVTNTSGSLSTGNAYTQSAAQFGASDPAIAAALNDVVNAYVDPIDYRSVSFGGRTLSPIAADVRGNVSTYILNPGGSTSFASVRSYSRGPFTFTDAATLAAFSRAGGGTFSPLFSTLTGLVISNSGGNTTASQTTTGQGSLVISFNYTVGPIGPPPPPTVPGPMAALPFALMAIKRRKRA